jgi:hypothetical protein
MPTGYKMNINENTKKYILFAFFAGVAFSGAYFITNINLINPIIARGIIGLAIIYQLITYGPLPGKADPIKSPFEFLRDFKFWVSIFVGGGVFYWALQQVFLMISTIF